MANTISFFISCSSKQYTTMSSKHHIFLFLTIISFLPTYYTTDHTINTSRILRDNGYDTLISARGTYEFGFFSSNNHRYVGIWYKKISVQTIVWIANRDTPLTEPSSASLKVVHPGLLVLLNNTNGIIWSTNTSTTAQTPVAQLLDSGNLVVKDANDDNILWQSFDYPTDTLLAGMKLGWNFKTGHEVYIRSPKNSGDPGSGEFTYHCDPTGYPHNVLKQGDLVKFRSGPWNGVSFSGSKNLRKNSIFKFGVVINENEVYYHYELENDSVYTRLTQSESGLLQRWLWDDKSWTIYLVIPTDTCDMFNQCGPYGNCDIENPSLCECLSKFEPKDPQGWERGNRSSGCIRRAVLNCEKGDVFLKYSGIKLPDTRDSWFNETLSLEECKQFCLRNCSCTAYTNPFITGDENGCLLWFGDLIDIRQVSQGQDIYIRMASSESGKDKDSKGSEGRKREILIVTMSVVFGIVLLCLCLLLYCQKRKKFDLQMQERDRLRLNLDNRPDQSNKDFELPLFDLSTITKATDDFSLNNKLGEGGFGPVYKGLLEDGQEIAVKRLSRMSLQGVDEFKNEVICIAKLQHRNLVKLLGCCIQGEEKILVYEYMTNKSLDLILFDPTRSILLDWPTRFNIIKGIARGLMYLHQDSRLRVIHRDLKASNILLDSDMNPKISDFGLARAFGGDETGANTSRVVGTYGYMSPEYAVDGIFSVKSDVFSFGVIVLEIVSGKRNRGFSHRDHHLNLLGHAWMLYKDERSLELVDSCLRNSYYLSEVVRSIHVGLLCVQERAEDRPSMSTVVLMLSNEGILPEAKHPGFFTGRDILKTESSVSSSNTENSKNTMTITLLEAR